MSATATIAAASPAKLKSGEWGARVNGGVSIGDLIQITTRAGEAWTATVSAIVWEGEGKTLVATGKAPAARGNARTTSRARRTPTWCTECGERIQHEEQECWEMGGRCAEWSR